jgi:hypothetical protein
MLKKTALCLSALLLSCSAFAQTLVRLDLVADEESYSQSVVINGTETAECQLSDLAFEVQISENSQQDQTKVVVVKIFRVSEDSKTLVAEPKFTTSADKSASLSFEKDGKEMKLIVVAVDVE